MRLSLLGLITALTVGALSLFFASQDVYFFLQPHALLVVAGGTLAMSMICFPLRALIGFTRVILKKFIGGKTTTYEEVIIEIVQMARNARNDADFLKKPHPEIKTLFLRDAADLLKRAGVSEERLMSILHKHASTFSRRYDDDVIMVKTIAQFPVILGLIGALLAMIHPLQALKATDSLSLLAPALAASFVPILYGLSFSRLILIPLSEKLIKLNQIDATIREMIVDGTLLISRKEHPVLIEEHLKGFLLPSERRKLKT